MNSLVAIAYVSSSVARLTETHLEHILVDSRLFNLAQRVTGVLLHHDGSFFQYFEGPAAGTKEVYDKIKRATRHENLVELLHERIDRRLFDDWGMGFSSAPKSFHLQLERARWGNIASTQRTGTASSAGVDLLLQFWRNASRGVF